jgi:phage FluMu protein Com
MYEYFEIQAERCKEIDKMMLEMEEAPEQLDLFKEYNER